VKEKIRGFIFKLKIFGWYLLTEPFKQFRSIIRSLVQIINLLGKNLTWVYITLALIIASLLVGNKYHIAVFTVALLIFMLLWEWQRGFYIYRYKQKMRKHIKKVIEEKEKPNL